MLAHISTEYYVRLEQGRAPRPSGLARRRRPVSFVDVVYRGATFTDVFDLLRTWVNDEHLPWSTIRRKLRFVGVTSRTKTSPNTYRWQQYATWTRHLPPQRWLAVTDGPGRDQRTRQSRAVRREPALAEPRLRTLVTKLNAGS